jgi:hypothetical protein
MCLGIHISLVLSFKHLNLDGEFSISQEIENIQKLKNKGGVFYVSN